MEEKLRDEKSKKEQIRLRALSARNSAKLAIDNIREFDVPTKRLDELIEKSESALQFDDYDNAIKFANQAEREALRQLKLDVESITELDHAVDEALIKLMETINRVHEQERKAWGQFTEIARVLSEKKARELFYQMDVAWRNIKSMSVYL